jgi:hypothetical protein
MVTPTAADAVERAVNAGAGGSVEIETVDGLIVVLVPRIVYLKRFTKGSQPGFAAARFPAAIDGASNPASAHE